jgi:hypothetical protein
VMAVTRLSGGLTPGNGADPRTFPAIWNGTADDIEAGDYSKVPTGGAAGEVLAKVSATDYDGTWVQRSITPILTSQHFYGPIANTTNTANNNTAYFSLVYFATPTVVDAIRCEVTTAGSAGTVVRMGIYAPGSDGAPDALIVDAGTVLADTTGIKSITINQTISGLVHCVLVAQGSNVVLRASSIVNNLYEAGTDAASNLTIRSGRFSITNFTGALPSSANPSASRIQGPVICQLKVA